MIDAVRRWCFDAEGSTRAIGLIRIALAALAWSKFGSDLSFFYAGDWLTLTLAWIFYPATLLMFLGLFTRAAVAVTAVTLGVIYFVFGQLLAQTPFGHVEWAQHHGYLLFVATALLALTPCGRSYSLDRYFAVIKAEREGRPAPREWGPLWGQRLIGLQLSALYFWTAVDKTAWSFLSGERLEQAMIWIYDGRPMAHLLLDPVMLSLVSIAVVLLEYALVVGIHIRRLQPILLPLGIALHLAFYLLVPVVTFSATMICLYLAVLDPQRVHDFIERLHGRQHRMAA